MNFNDLLRIVDCSKPENYIFLGLGNDLRSDDAAGLILFRKLEAKPELHGARFIEAGSNPENYLQVILDSGAEHVVIIDAAKSGAEPGTIRILDPGQFDHNRISTHAFSMDMIEGYLNHHRTFQFLYLGIEPLTTGPGQQVSPSITNAIDRFFEMQ